MQQALPRQLQHIWQGYFKIPAIILLWIFIAFQSFRISRQNGGTDLRARVVGARLLFSENSPYFYTWKQGDPEEWMDPNIKPGRGVNGNVVTPAVLLLMQPLVYLPYHFIRPVWTILELLAALLTIYWLAGKKNLRDLLGFSFIPALLLLTGPYWLYHIDRGQMYIFFAAMLAGTWYLYNKTGRGKFYSGLVTGLFVFIRPFAISIALPYMAAQQKAWLRGFAAGVLGGFLLFFLPMQDAWKDYGAAMKIYSAEAMGIITDAQVVPAQFPEKIEHTENLRTFGEYGVNAFPTALQLSEKWNLKIPQWISYAALTLLFAFLGIFFYQKRVLAPDKLKICSFLVLMACEYATHAPRAPYNLLMWLAPICLWLATNKTDKPFAKITFFVLLFLFLHPAFLFGYSLGYAAEFLLLLMTLYFILYQGRQVKNAILPGSPA